MKPYDPHKYLSEDKLEYADRKKLPDSAFALPKERKYPLIDIQHGRNALARVAQNGTPEEIAKVKKAVHAKFPSIDKEEEK